VTIQLAAGAAYTLTCTAPGDENANADGDLDLYGSAPAVTIEGAGSRITPAAGCVDERLIDVYGPAEVVVRDLTLAGGRGALTGGIVVDRATRIVLERVRIEGAVATPGICTGECIVNGGARLSAQEAIELRDVVATANTARLTGCRTLCRAVGGLGLEAPEVRVRGAEISANQADAGSCASRCTLIGGVLLAAPAAHLEQTRIVDNAAQATACALCETVGGLSSGLALTVERSAIVGNRAAGGDLAAGGAAVESATFATSTVSDNEVTGTTLLHGGGIVRRSGSTELRSSTIVDNVSPSGVDNVRVLQAEQIVATATVIGSASGASGCSLGVAVSTATASFESGTGCFAPAPGVVTSGGDPQLAPAAAGAPWRTPQATSPLVDAAGTGCTGIDQAGAPRPFGPACDVGAIEYRPAPVPPPAVDAARYVPLEPTRLFDTRPGSEPAGPKGLVSAGETLTVQVAGIAGVPGEAVAVALNVTATEAAGAGYVTVWPADQPRPEASNLNLTASGQTRANLVTVPVSATGRVSLYAERGAHLIADVAGYYERVGSAQAAGRIVTVPPRRLFDTRSHDASGVRSGVVGDGQTIEVPVAGHAGVPAAGVAAVVLNVTATDAVAAGYVTVWPAGRPRPLASTLNLDAAGATSPNLVIVPLGAGGAVALYASGGAHLLADVTGYVTDPSAPAATTGLFVPVTPTRAFDTRTGTAVAGPKGAVPAGGSVSATITGIGGIPAGASGVAVNVTATQVAGAGFGTAWPSGTDRPDASTLNVVSDDTRANAALLPLGAGGLDLYTLTASHLLADVAGYFLP
jgi:hypothetical protein